VMAEQELPGLLIMDIGGTHGVQENIAALLKKHFFVITMKELLENKKEMGKKIQSIFVSELRPTIDRELLESLPNLKVIGNSGVGVDHLNLKMISNFGIKVTNTPHAVADSTADMGMALMLASARRLVEGSQIAVSPDTKYFAADWLGVEVTGATLGIIGMGRIGYKVAQRARAFEMKILYHNRNRRSKEDEQAVGAHYTEMEDLLQQSDFVMLVVNLTPETEKLIGKRELGLMKPTATLINISRGRNISRRWLWLCGEVNLTAKQGNGVNTEDGDMGCDLWHLLDTEDELSDIQSDSVPSEVRDWLASTVTRQMGMMLKRTEEKPWFRSIVHAVEAGIFVERVYRRTSNTVGLSYPPAAIGVLKIPVSALVSFVEALQVGSSKHKNPHHSLTHAADGTQTVHQLLFKTGRVLEDPPPWAPPEVDPPPSAPPEVDPPPSAPPGLL
ncbi:hypothetical protein ASZ78_013475, partial [Callipepla squamata]